ncbi:hypothetical protein SHKM778_39110 [Streptomyces sp. KM77-8]|uniref:Uncharacterized protein n=1 Tax=Streptomyces haneummycinicus TaxID=3074435 RepID=A0AAT9HJH7_9ACTN
MVGAGDVGDARGDAGGDDDLVVSGHVVGGDARVEAYVDGEFGEAGAEVAQGLVEFLLAGDLAGDVELAADLARGVEQGDVVAAFGGADGAGEAGRARADDGHALAAAGRGEDQLGLVAGARVDQAGGDLPAEGVVEAGLVAADAGVDRLGPAVGGLGDEVGVGEHGAGHRHHVRRAVGEQPLGEVGVLMRFVVTSGTDTSPMRRLVTQVYAPGARRWRWWGCGPRATRYRC